MNSCGSGLALAFILCLTAVNWFNLQDIQNGVMVPPVRLLLFFGLAPICSIGLVIWLLRSNSKLMHLSYHYALRDQFKENMLDAGNLDSTVDLLFRYLRLVIPLTGGAFFMEQLASDRYELVAEIWLNKKPFAVNEDKVVMKPCNRCLRKRTKFPRNILSRFRPLNQLSIMDHPEILSFPILSDRRKTALLCLYLAGDGDLSGDHIDFLTQITTESLPALALARAREGQSFPLQISSPKPEYEQIAHYLHDTLANDLSILKLKIDQLWLDVEPYAILDLQPEIRQMRVMADKSYRQVRDLLSDLDKFRQQNLEHLIREYIADINYRSGIEFDFIHRGRSRNLPAYVHRNVVYIIREALRNIEKHAKVMHARVVLGWDSELMTIKVSDDGVGFDKEAAKQKAGHIGLQIMYQCAQDINARLEIDSTTDKGTQLTFALPLKESKL